MGSGREEAPGLGGGACLGEGDGTVLDVSLEGSSPDLPGPAMWVQGLGVPPWEGGYQEKKGRACPQHVSSERLGAGGAQSDKAHRRASGPSRVLLSQTLPLQPCPQLGGGRQAQPVGSSGQSGLRELWAVGREEEESPSFQSPLCPTLQTGVEKDLPPGLRRQSEVPLPPPMSLLLQSQPCPVHCGWQPRW